MTYFPVTALRSVDLATPDIARAEAFYTAVWGLDVAARGDGVVYLRGTGEDHHLVALHPADKAEILSVTFRLDTPDAFAAIARAAIDHGGVVIREPAPHDGPEGGTAMTIRDAQGWVLRFVHGDRRYDHASAEPNRPVRLAHVNLNSADVDASVGFFERVLGFRLTDRTKLMGFVRCNADHHAVVIAEAPAAGLNHIAFLMPDLESVMRGAGRLVDAGFPIAWGVGRHGPGDNVFAYFVGSDGFVVEYTAEVLQVDDGYAVRGPAEWIWPPGRTDHWGIAPPKAEHVKQAQLAIRFRPA